MADGGDALGHGDIDAVAEGEEAVGNDDGTGKAALVGPGALLDVLELCREAGVCLGLFLELVEGEAEPVPMAVVAPPRAKMTELEVTPASTAQAKRRSSSSCRLGLRAM